MMNPVIYEEPMTAEEDYSNYPMSSLFYEEPMTAEEKEEYSKNPMSSIFMEIADELNKKTNDEASEKGVNEQKKTEEEYKPILDCFKEYAKVLDERQNKYEDLVRKSRDLKIESTRIMYLLDRIDG